MKINNVVIDPSVYSQAAELQNQINSLVQRRDALFTGEVVVSAPVTRSTAAGASAPATSTRKPMSPASRAKIAAAARARWAKIKKTGGSAAGSRKGGMSPAGRKKIAKAQKARWAKIHAAQDLAASTALPTATA